jgi:hypothetical protein
MSWLRAGNPNAADTVSGVYSGVLAAQAFRNGHKILGTVNVAGAALSAHSIYQRKISENTKADEDQQYWAGVAGLPFDQQWQYVDAFRRGLCQEYAKRLRCEDPAELAPVPTYAQAIEDLNANPV